MDSYPWNKGSWSISANGEDCRVAHSGVRTGNIAAWAFEVCDMHHSFCSGALFGPWHVRTTSSRLFTLGYSSCVHFHGQEAKVNLDNQNHEAS